jgi:hypothetical protein
MAFLYIDHADKDKYGQFIENIKVQHLLGNRSSQYPDTLEEATCSAKCPKVRKMAVLSVH